MPYTSSTRYDAAGRVTGTISADPDPGAGPGGTSGPLPFIAVRNSYSPSGELIRVETGTLATWQSEAVAPANWTGFTLHRYADTLYDAMGRKLRETLRSADGAAQQVTQYSYDALGRLECTAVRMNPADFGSPPPSACAQGTGGGDRISRNIYDLAGQRLQVRAGGGTSVEGAQATWDYNLNGQPVTMIDGNGNRAALVYDGHGRQICWMFPSIARPSGYNDATPASALATAGAPSGTIEAGQCASGDYEAYAYDPNDNRTSLRKRDGRTIAFAYDALNRVTAKTYPQGGATAVFYGYDLRNLQLHARFGSAAGEGVTNAYDGFGRLASSSTNMGGTTRSLAYAYDRNGNRTGITHPDGISFAYSYDGANRPVWIHGPGGVWQIYAGYTTDGALAAWFGANGTANHRAYDGLQRVYAMALTFPASGADVSWVFSRNPAGQIASIARDNDAYAWTGAYNTARPYTTNGLNQYSVTGPPGTAGSVSFTYDANGNLASEATWNGTTYIVSAAYSYDIENR
jgi:YD repeat-containing protein